MLADLIAVADAEIAALAGKAFVERVGAEHRAGRDFVPLPERGPAFHVDVRFQHAAGADRNIAFDHAIFADVDSGSDDGLRVNPRGRRQHGRGVDAHELVS